MASSNRRTLEIALFAKNMTKKAFTGVIWGLRRIRRVGRSAMRTLSNVTMAARTQMALLLGVIGGFQAIVRAPADFNKQLQFTGTLGEEARENLESFREEVQRLSVESGIPIEQMNSALFDLVSAGTKASDAIGVLRESARLAVGGMADLRSAVRGLATVTNAYGFSGQKAFRRVANELFAAQVIGKTTIEDLSENVGKLASTAAEAGIPIRQLFTAFADSANVMNNTEQAAVALRQAIMGILKPNENMKEVLTELNIPLGEAAFQGRTLGELFGAIKVKAKELNIPFTTVVGNVRAIAAASVLAQEDGARFARMMARQAKLAGELSIAYKNMRRELATTLDRLTNLGKVLAQQFSKGALIGLNEGLVHVLENLRVFKIDAEIAGLRFRKAMENVMPITMVIVESFKFMGASIKLVFTSIAKMWDDYVKGPAISTMAAIHETMVDLGMVDPTTRIQRFNNEVEKFGQRWEKTQTRLKEVRKELKGLGSDAKVRFREWAKQNPGNLGGTAEYLKQLSDIKRLQDEELALLERQIREDFTRNELLKDRAKLIKAGAKAAAAQRGWFRGSTEERDAARDSVADLLLSGEIRADLVVKNLTFDQQMAQSAKETKKTIREALKEQVESLHRLHEQQLKIGASTEFTRSIEDQIKALEKQRVIIAEGLPESLNEWRIAYAIHSKTMAGFLGEGLNLAGPMFETSGALAGIRTIQQMQVEAARLKETIASTAKEFHNWRPEEGSALHLLMEEFGTLEEQSNEFLDAWKKGVQEAVTEMGKFNTQAKELGTQTIKSLENATASMFEGWITGTKTAKEAFTDFLMSTARLLSQFMAKRAVLKFMALFGVTPDVVPSEPVDVNIGSGDFVNVAAGGIVRRPTFTMTGEAGPEAVVPLPNGKAIPVDFRGGGGGAITINISAVDGPSVQRMLMSDDGRRAIQSAVRDARATRRDFR